MKKGSVFTVLLIFSCINLVRSELRIVPIFNAELNGGQSRFEDNSSSGANFNLNLSPVLRFNEKTALLPWLGINYSGVRTATEIVDYGNLYQQVQDYLLDLKLIHKPNNTLKYRLESGYKKEYVQETRDESWGEGLYDYNNVFFGLGVEKRIKANSFEVAYRYSGFEFPNYTTLSSQQGQPLMGTHIFDNNINRLFLNTDFTFLNRRDRRIFLNVRVNLDRINYPDQKVQDSNGGFLSEKRQDSALGLNNRIVFSTFKPNFDTSFGLKLAIKNKSSNQNFFDVDNFQFIPNFFDYRQTGIEPYLVVRFHPRDISLNIGYEITTKNYTDRLAQNSDGTYETDKAYVKTSIVKVGLNYPLMQKLNLVFSVASRKNSSNIKFEKFYKYNFNTSDFLLGFTYEY